MSVSTQQLEIWIRQACLVEVRSEKAGNVTPVHSFRDASIADFEYSAHVIAPILATAADIGVGPTVLNAVQATRDAVGHNTNLGIVLLLAPLASVPSEQTLAAGISSVLENLSIDDATAVYRAISLAAPGGLGTAKSQDVHQPPTANLRECMQLAESRDRIAAQYVNDFRDVLDFGIAELRKTAAWTTHRKHRIAWLSLTLLSQLGDSLIQRKCGPDVERDVICQASSVLQSGWPFAEESWQQYQSFDEFLRADGHSRNPGTTADMIAAILFAALRDGIGVVDDAETHLIFAEERHV